MKTTSSIILFLLIALAKGSEDSAEESQEFNVRPGVDEPVEVTVKGVTCKFSYSCNGGTNEIWQITLSSGLDGYDCFVGRPSSPSYLQFKNFQLSVAGKTKTRISSVDLKDGTGKILTQGDHYLQTDKEVSTGPKFEGTVGSVHVHADPVKSARRRRQKIYKFWIQFEKNAQY